MILQPIRNGSSVSCDGSCSDRILLQAATQVIRNVNRPDGIQFEAFFL
jgi:hypothetical protein